MTRTRNNQDGFSPVEVLLLAVFVGLIGFVGWYVYNAKHSTEKVVSSSQTSKAAAQKSSTGTDKTAVTGASATTSSKSLDEINSAISQNDKDLNGIDQSLNDSSTFTSVPQ